MSGELFQCANVRERLVLIGFRDPECWNRFTPPPPLSAKPLPLSSIVKHYTVETGGIRRLLLMMMAMTMMMIATTTMTMMVMMIVLLLLLPFLCLAC